MRKHGAAHMMCLLLAAGMALRATALGEDEAAEQKTTGVFTLRLIDGSSIICRPKLDVLTFRTSSAEMKVPLREIVAIRIEHKENIATLSLLNGDRLQGRCLLEEITVASMVGDLKVPLASVAELTTAPRKEPVFAGTPARSNACINNLRQIDSGKEQWALANRKADRDEVDIHGVNEYIKGNRTPVCPSGGKYTYNVVGVDPECSVPGHGLR